MELKVGDKVKNGRRILEVYQETSSNGKKYLALRHWDSKNRFYDEYNGDIKYYLEGFYGGIKLIYEFKGQRTDAELSRKNK